MTGAPLQPHHRFHLRPAILAAAGLAGGIFLAYRTQGMFAIFAACLFLFCGALACPRKASAAILCFAAAAGIFRMQASLPALPPEGTHALSGTVAQVSRSEKGHCCVLLYDANLSGVPLSGHLRITFSDRTAEKLKAGDMIAVTAQVQIPEKLPGSTFDPRAYYLSEGISALARTDASPTVTGHRIGPAYRLAQLQERIGDGLSAAFGKESALAAALLLNDKTCLSEDVAEAFRSAGVAHILALSGLHVSIFVSLLAAIIPKRLPRLRIFLITAFLLCYCILAGFPPSLLRAAVMALLALAAPLCARRYDSPSALAFSLLLILFVSPQSLFSVGLQLSFAATAAILLLQKPFFRLLRQLPEKLRSALSVTLSGTAGTFPLTILYFGRLPLYTVFANLLIVPLIGILLPLLLLTAVVVCVFPETAPLALPVRHMLTFLRILTEEFAALPGAVIRFADIPAAGLLLPYPGMLMLSPYHLRPKKERLTAASLFLGAAAAVLLLRLIFPAA